MAWEDDPAFRHLKATTPPASPAQVKTVRRLLELLEELRPRTTNGIRVALNAALSNGTLSASLVARATNMLNDRLGEIPDYEKEP
jgi:hypothetical protein